MPIVSLFIHHHDDRWDAKKDLKVLHDVDLNGNAICHEIVYADDTLLIDAAGDHLQVYMECVTVRAKIYELALNFSNIENVTVK